jgi:hypothetical protein
MHTRRHDRRKQFQIPKESGGAHASAESQVWRSIKNVTGRAGRVPGRRRGPAETLSDPIAMSASDNDKSGAGRPLPESIYIPGNMVAANRASSTSTSWFLFDRFKENPFVFAGTKLGACFGATIELQPPMPTLPRSD